MDMFTVLRYSFRAFVMLCFLVAAELAVTFYGHSGFRMPAIAHQSGLAAAPPADTDSVTVLSGTFLGNEKRNYYGDSIGDSLNIVWRCLLGGGKTIVTKEKGTEEWFGAGWTGQPLVVRENNRLFLIQGCYDHHLKKIDAHTGEVVWQYTYDDILKGTGTIWKDVHAADPSNRFVILQGSRYGYGKGSNDPEIFSYRAVSYLTGKELWRMNVKRGPSYSRDVDASALVIRDTAYIGLENASFVAFDPAHALQAEPNDSGYRPRIHYELPLYAETDRAKHGGNLVTEASPARLGNHIYLASGAGHVYGFNLDTKTIDWDFVTGSDMDGSPVVTADNCLLVTIEKQYIAGRGGVMKLNPALPPEKAVVWYYETSDYKFSSWIGGVIGSAAVNDFYAKPGMPQLAAFTGIDGWLTVVQHDRIVSDSLSTGPDGKTKYPKPHVVFRQHIGPSISTPVFSGSRLVAAGYAGINLFGYDSIAQFTKLMMQGGGFESSPVACGGRIYIASRDGYLYCFGSQAETVPLLVKQQPQAKPEVAVQKTKQPVVAYAWHLPVVEKNAAVYAAKRNISIAQNEAVAAAQPKAEPYPWHFPEVHRDSPPVRVADTVVVIAQPAAPVVVQPEPVVSAPVAVTADNAAAPDLGHAYYLVAGAFKSGDNAKRAVKNYKKQGVTAIIKQAGEMNYVIVASGNSENELETRRVELMNLLRMEVWMKKKQ